MAITENNEGKTCCGCCSCLPFRRKKDLQESSRVPNDDQNIENSTYSEEFKEPLETGTFITVNGLIREHCLRFSIDFVCGSNNPNIAFHFNPRLEQYYVVRNSRTNGYWGEEETTSLSGFVFKPSEQFSISFLVTADEYFVTVNGKHCCSFAHRIPIRQVVGLEVQGNVEISSVGITNIDSYPPGDDDIYPEVPFDENFEADVHQPKGNPFIGTLPKSFRPGWQLEIYGKVKMLPHSFYVNLQDSAKYWPHPIIPLHLNPRFGHGGAGGAGGGNGFVRNAWVPNQGWGNEERAPNFPFSPGYSFCMVVRMEMDGYSVWVDGKLTGEFRYPPDVDFCVRCVYIQGDVFINHVTVRQHIEDTYFINPQERIIKL